LEESWIITFVETERLNLEIGDPIGESSAASKIDIDIDLIGLKDLRLALSTLSYKLCHSRVETSDSCNTPEIDIKSDITPNAVWRLLRRGKLVRYEHMS
jgi:hypothetical protein